MQKGFHEPDQKPRRFYKSVTVLTVDDGFGVALDARRLRAPNGDVLVLPTRAIAQQVADEWDAQAETINVAEMHVNRLANTALQAIAAAREATAHSVADYAASDLLCYFSEAPSALADRQQAQWGPVLARAGAELGLHFVRATGIIHQDQPPETLAKVKALALEADDFTLAGLAFGVSLFGSAILSLAVQRGWLAGRDAYALSRLDEAFQEEQWGVDEEAALRTARLYGEAEMLERWFKSLSEG